MQATTLIRSLTLALVFASAASPAVFAGHEDFVQQHRFTRAELSGVLYLPGDAEAAIAAGAPAAPDAYAVIITASHACGDDPVHTCRANAANP